jgi:hypothetical protein
VAIYIAAPRKSFPFIEIDTQHFAGVRCRPIQLSYKKEIYEASLHAVERSGVHFLR